jgi:hypothetical protein
VEGSPKPVVPTIDLRVSVTFMLIYWPAVFPLEHVVPQVAFVSAVVLGQPQNWVGVTLMPDKPVELTAAFVMPVESQPFSAA